MERDYQKWVKGLISGRVLFDVPMKQLTSIKVGGPADTVLFPKDVKELGKILRWVRKKKIPMMILGKGTNLLVRDQGFRGWVICLTQGFKRVHQEGDVVEADSGVLLQRLVQFAIQRGLSGLEPFFGIPGTVGGGLAMNAGAWGVELKDVLLSMTLMKDDAEVVERPRQKLKFSYRALELP
ncbi:MAG: FAD-binding protein, partial [candidate division WOR-3 bacterium]